MLYYIISDIHGNYEALKVCLEDIRQQPTGTVICLGDVVGYGVEPNECCDTVRMVSKVVLMGNHDSSATSDQSLESFNPYAKEAMLWTRGALTEGNHGWLADLVMTYSESDLFFVHATPFKPEEWNYIFYLSDAEVNFRAFKEHVCFVGHSHQPIILEKSPDGKIYVSRDTKVTLKDDAKYIVNVGSVGQPRDQDWRASYAIYDTDQRSLEIRRLEYPLERTQEKMREAGLHPFLIERLALGR